jgi:hypothetical protein
MNRHERMARDLGAGSGAETPSPGADGASRQTPMARRAEVEALRPTAALRVVPKTLWNLPIRNARLSGRRGGSNSRGSVAGGTACQ